MSELKPGYITKNFSFQELTYSQTASRRGIDNTPTNQHKLNLIESTRNLWQPIRDALGVPVSVSSGYRGPKLNAAIGGAKNSSHMHGFAIDFRVHSVPNCYLLAEKILQIVKEKGLSFDQLILEFPSGERKDPNNHMPGAWIHLGYKSPSGQHRRQVLTAVKRNGRTVYLEGLQ